MSKIVTLENVLKKKYKLSAYNLYISKNNNIVIFNTRTSNIVELESPMIIEEYVEDLLRLGMIVTKETNELKQLKEEYNNRSLVCNSFNAIIAVTQDCQCRCFYCYEEHPKVYMDDRTKSSLVELVKKHASLGEKINIVWYGGEPLLDFQTIVELTTKFQSICKKYDVKYSAQMISNAYGFDNRMISQIDDLDIKEVQITLDGLREEHNKRRPVIGDKDPFETIINNILQINSKSHTNIKVRINVDKNNSEEAYRVIDLLKDYNLEHFDITLGMLKTFGCTGHCTRCNSLFSMKEFANEYVRFRDYLKINGFEKACSKMQPIPKMNACTLDSPNSYVIGPDGECYKCISQVGEKEHSIGNVNTGFDEEAHKQFSAFNFESCRHCKYLPICRGGCLYRKAKIDNSECEIWKYCTEKLIKELVK